MVALIAKEEPGDMLIRLIALYAGLLVLCIAVLTVGGPAFGAIEAGITIAVFLLIAILGTRRIRRRHPRRRARATDRVDVGERK